MPALFEPTASQRALLERVEPLLRDIAERAELHDRAGTLPNASIEALRDSGYFAAAVPRDAGGLGHGLADAVVAQAALARADGSVALSVGMHLMVCGTEAERRSWPDPLRERVFREVVNSGALLNNIAAEPAMGSPKGGGCPATTIRRDGDGYRVDGHKVFCTLAPALDYLVVYGHLVDDDTGETAADAAADEAAEPAGEPRVARVIVPAVAEGISIEPTWDSLGMRATASHDIRFDDVHVPLDALATERGLSEPEAPTPMAWFPLLVAACSLGLADRALASAVETARRRRPTGYDRPIGAIASVREQLARAELALNAAWALLLGTAAAWDRRSQHERAPMKADLAAAKVTATNAAVEVVDRAMRVVGGAALRRGHPLERIYRDVRSGLVNPPIDARALEAVAARLVDGAG